MHTKPLDGRYIILLSVLIYLLIVYIGSLFIGYYEFSKYLGVTTHTQRSFADIYYLLKVAECNHQGYNVYQPTACADGIFLVYPKIWLGIYYTGLKADNALIIGLVLISILFISLFKLIGKISLKEGLYYSLFLSAPPIVYCIEYGNPDIIIFILCVISVLLFRNKISRKLLSLPLMFAAFLKLFPFITIASLLDNNKSKSIKIFLSLLSISLLYITINWNHILFFSHIGYNYYFLGSWEGCFGARAVFDYFDQYEPIHNNIFSLLPSTFFAYGTTILILVMSWIFARRFKFNLPESDFLFSFKLGALLYIGIFLLGKQYDYKLILLLLVIPQLFQWIKDPRIKALAFSALVGIIISLWSHRAFDLFNSVGLRYKYFLMTMTEETINWLLLGFFTFMLLNSLPIWAKKWLALP